MNPLTQILQCLKRTTRSWNMIIDPDPKKYPGFQRVGYEDVYEFWMKLQSGVDLKKDISQSPLYGGASNIGPCRGKKSKVKWIRIIDNKDLRNADGQTVREILIDTLNKFPTYDLQSQQGSEAAIRDIDDKISSVASIEAMDTLKTANMR